MTFDMFILLLCLALVFAPKYIRGPRGAYLGLAWFVVLAIAVASAVITSLLTPKPKGPKPPSATDIEDPTNEAGRSMMVVFGEGVIKSPNLLGFGDKSVRTYEVKA